MFVDSERLGFQCSSVVNIKLKIYVTCVRCTLKHRCLSVISGTEYIDLCSKPVPTVIHKHSPRFVI